MTSLSCPKVHLTSHRRLSQKRENVSPTIYSSGELRRNMRSERIVKQLCKNCN